MLSENLQQVEEKIADACKRAKRERSEVTLIAVSKTKPISMLQEFITKEYDVLVKIKYRS